MLDTFVRRSFYCFIEPQYKPIRTPRSQWGVIVYEMQFYVFNFSVSNSNDGHYSVYLLRRVVAIIVCVTCSVLKYLIIFLILIKYVYLM